MAETSLNSSGQAQKTAKQSMWRRGALEDLFFQLRPVVLSRWLYLLMHGFHRQTLHLHNLERISRRTGTRPQNIIENHLSIDDILFEVVIFHLGQEISHLNQLQVMGREQAEAGLARQCFDIGFTANTTLT